MYIFDIKGAVCKDSFTDFVVWYECGHVQTIMIIFGGLFFHI